MVDHLSPALKSYAKSPSLKVLRIDLCVLK